MKTNEPPNRKRRVHMRRFAPLFVAGAMMMFLAAGCETTAADCYFDGVVVDCSADYCADTCVDANGYDVCVDIMTDDLNCGGCAIECAAGDYCWDGACAAGTCEDAGYVTCGDMCSDLTDDFNCGDCFVECVAGCDTVNLVCF